MDQHRTTGPFLSKQVLGGLIVLSLLTGCGTFTKIQDSAPPLALNWDEIPDAVPRAEPLSETGNPESYEVLGKRYFVDFDTKYFRQRGIASWYGSKFHGRKTSSGEVYDMYAMTAAHKTLPLPAYVKVKNLHNDKQVIVRVNDRGPFVDGRIIDLSYTAAQKLGITGNGTADVEIETALPAGASSRLQYEKNTPSTLYYVQLGAFSQRAHAEDLLTRLTSQAITPVAISRNHKEENSLFRVRVGPFADKRQLQTMETQLSELGYTPSYIITE
ncbi:MAG TPA: septal ring lytic transglycosylase RlpA family protein [Gammaproteobacteria bacterium]